MEQRTFELHKNLQGSKTIAEKAKRTEQRFHLLATQETEFGVPQSQKDLVNTLSFPSKPQEGHAFYFSTLCFRTRRSKTATDLLQ